MIVTSYCPGGALACAVTVISTSVAPSAQLAGRTPSPRPSKATVNWNGLGETEAVTQLVRSGGGVMVKEAPVEAPGETVPLLGSKAEIAAEATVADMNRAMTVPANPPRSRRLVRVPEHGRRDISIYRNHNGFS